MQIFTPYAEPLRVAKALDPKRLRSQINECKVILRAIRGESDAWVNHPICKQFRGIRCGALWLNLYKSCLESYLLLLSSTSIEESVKYYERAYIANKVATACKMDFFTPDFLDQHKRRLYTKDPKHYAQWAELGTSDENWYSVDGELWKYCNGKRI